MLMRGIMMHRVSRIISKLPPPPRPMTLPPQLNKVHYVLDEIIMGGMVLETNINQILTAINDQNRLHSASNKVGLPSGGAMNPSGRPRPGGPGGMAGGGSGMPTMRTR